MSFDRDFRTRIRDADGEELLTLRQYLTRKVILEGTDIWTAIEAVNSTALAHPEWELEEEKTWEEWQAG